MTACEIGLRVRARLLREGGFVWSHKDGTKTVHFNKGRKPTVELIAALKKYRQELATAVDFEWEKNKCAWQKLPPPVVGTGRRNILITTHAAASERN